MTHQNLRPSSFSPNKQLHDLVVAQLPRKHRRGLSKAVDCSRVSSDFEKLVDDEDAATAGSVVQASLVGLGVAVARVGTSFDQLDGAIFVVACCEKQWTSSARVGTS